MLRNNCPKISIQLIKDWRRKYAHENICLNPPGKPIIIHLEDVSRWSRIPALRQQYVGSVQSGAQLHNT